MDEMRLTPGDVLLLDPEWIQDAKKKSERQDCISLLICELDHSPVSHAALYYGDGEMAEENLGGLVLSPVPAPGESRRTVYVRRCGESGCDTRAIIRAADKYLTNKEPYALGTLVAAGLLLLTRRFVRTSIYIALAKAALLTLCELLLERCPGKNPMTCAQFVARCYREAGTVLIPDDPKSAAGGDAAAGTSLAGLAAGALRAPGAAAPSWEGLLHAPDAAGFDPKALEDAFEALCCAILRLLKSAAAEESSPAGAQSREDAGAGPGDEALMTEDFVNAAALFARIVLHGMPEHSAASLSTATAGAGDLEKLRDAFVSPGDLFRCAKLEDKGVIPPKEQQ